jgi:hypothetical protein
MHAKPTSHFNFHPLKIFVKHKDDELKKTNLKRIPSPILFLDLLIQHNPNQLLGFQNHRQQPTNQPTNQPNKTKQNKTKQNKTKQNKTKQNKTKQNIIKNGYDHDPTYDKSPCL